jgi:hypothetical protein
MAFEPWDAGSHAATRSAIDRHGRLCWNWYTLPRGNWRIRLRLGAVALSKMAAEAVGVPDVLFATSLMSFSDLIALLPREYSAAKRVFYVHEHQACYPAQDGRHDTRDAHATATNLTSMLAADCILWNSQWTRDSFLEAADDLIRLGSLPRSVTDDIADRSHIAWPPVEVPTGQAPRVLHKAADAKNRGLTLVVWPHRWEHDKGPHELLALERKWGDRHRLGWILLGQQFESRPSEMQALIDSAGDRLVHAGYTPRLEYETWLSAADWVLSTASHEYFGIAVAEALFAGCLPWLPHRLSYPELLPTEAWGCTPMSPPEDSAALRDQIRMHLAAAEAQRAVAHIESLIESQLPCARR